MIVEDDTDIVALFEQFLTMTGHEIIAKAFDGEQAIEEYKKAKPYVDLILIDYRMPQKDGLLTTKEMLNMDPESKVIFMSADFSVKKQALDLGAIAFLEKPIDFGDLLKTIDQFSKESIRVQKDAR